MRHFPEEKELHELDELKALPWQADLLKLNPSYCSWGNFEDYMCSDKEGWASRFNASSWSEHFELNDLNEVVNFYFHLYRKNHECPHCDHTGLNPATHKISEDFYDFQETGRRWVDRITEDEVYALAQHGRICNFPDDQRYMFSQEKNTWIVVKDNKWVECDAPTMPTAESINAANRRGARGMGHSHDAINRWILIETRAKRLGVYGHCEHCEGRGYIYDEDFCRVALQLWVLHPRKGCSRGVYIENITQPELPEVFTYLREAAKRNQERFDKIPE